MEKMVLQSEKLDEAVKVSLKLLSSVTLVGSSPTFVDFITDNYKLGYVMAKISKATPTKAKEWYSTFKKCQSFFVEDKEAYSDAKRRFAVFCMCVGDTKFFNSVKEVL